MSRPTSPPQRPPANPLGQPVFPLRTALSAATLLRRFRKLFPAELLAQWLAPQRLYQRAFTPLITLWYLTLQRLGDTPTLERLLCDARAGGADALSPPGKRLSRQLRSASTAALSDSRQRFPLPALQKALRHSGQQIRAWVQGALWYQLHVVLLDGSTFRLRPHNDIAARFRPHRGGNNSQPYWCLGRVVVGFCLATGVALDCAVGSAQLGEQTLLLQMLLAHSWPDTLFVADRNFGTYTSLRAVTHTGGHALFRLTRSRALKLAKAAGADLCPGLDLPLLWNPSRQDHCPDRLERTPVAGRLLVFYFERPGFQPVTLYLFTTLVDRQAYPPQALAQLYGCRWQVELDLRYVKSQMHLDALECKTAEMACKEWIGGLLAYNLVRAVMTAAAATARVPLERLSFSRCRHALVDWLIRWAHKPLAQTPWIHLLEFLAQYTQPDRPQPRPSEPRAIRYFKKDVPKLSGDRAAARKKLKTANVKS